MFTRRLAVPASSSGAAHLRARVPSLFRAILSAMLAASPAATAISIGWNANPEADIARYQLHYGTVSGTYPNTIDAETSTSVPVTGLVGGTTYYFVVTAVNAAGLSSDPSAEISYTAPANTIPPANQAPVANAAAVSLNENSSAPIVLTASDADNDALSYTVVSNPSSGTLTGTAPNLTYTPAAGFSGADSFTFKANDGKLDSNTATVTLTVKKSTPPGDPNPLARTGWKIVLVDSEDATDNPAASAIDGNPATFWHTRWKTGATPPPHEIRIDLGAVRSLEGFRYLPRQDGFSVGNIGQFEFRTSLNGINWTSAASGTFANNSEEKEILFTAGNARYVSLKALSDASGSIHTSIAELNILGSAAVNTAPVASSAALTTVQKTALPITLEASDGEDDALGFTILAAPSNGTLTGTAPSLTYTPDAAFTGTDSFTYQVSDGSLTSNTATVTITVTPKGTVTGNRAPVFKTKTINRAAGIEDEPYKADSLNKCAEDPDRGDSITYTKAAGPAWLDVSPAGQLRGTPPAGSNGTQRFTIRASDKAGASDEAVLIIDIKAADLPLPWDLKPLGKAGPKTSATFHSGAFTLTAAGDFRGGDDAGCFVWRTLSGDGQITARVSDLDDAGKNASAGLMIRGSMAADSKQVFIGVNGGGDFRWITRTRAGASANLKPTGKGKLPHTWLGLSRRGDTITTYRSTNGKDWTKVGSTLMDLGKNCYIGLTVSSGNNAASTATFRNVKLKR